LSGENNKIIKNSQVINQDYFLSKILFSPKKFLWQNQVFSFIANSVGINRLRGLENVPPVVRGIVLSRKLYIAKSNKKGKQFQC
jgi:hypothetical protein